MVSSQELKEFALAHGADIVGIGSMDRFEGAPKEGDPRYIFPDAKAIIGLAFRINRGCFRGNEEGTYFAAYPSMGYAGINFRDAPITLRAICNYLEDDGYESVPIQNMSIMSSFDLMGIEPKEGEVKKKTSARPVSPDKPAPDVDFSFRIAAYICGMGEIGYSKVFLTPKFGPRQRFAFVLTDAPLEPDPIYDGPPICDKCMECVKQCSVGAISARDQVKVTIAGHEIEWGKVNALACSAGYCGANPHYNPFVDEDYDMKDAINNKFGARYNIPYNQNSDALFHLPGAIEGARCMRACFIHLEETGRLENKFKNKFRKREPWRL